MEYADDVWFPVDSTCLSHVMVSGPDLYVRIRKSGLEYGYAGASGEMFSLMNAHSVGIYYNTVIKKYPCHGPLGGGGRPAAGSGTSQPVASGMSGEDVAAQIAEAERMQEEFDNYFK